MSLLVPVAPKAPGITPSLRFRPHLGLGRTPDGRPLVSALVMGFAGILLASIISDGPVSRLVYAQSVDSSIEFAENDTSPVGWFRAYDQDGDPIRWSLGGPDADWFTIEGGVLRFREPPDYEQPHSAAGGPWAERNVYRVTIEASGGTHGVAVTVTDVDEVGKVTIDRPQPQVSRPLGANLSDEDDGVLAQTWQWARSEYLTTWTDIKGATSPRRSPGPDDVGMFLRATVTYTDKFGSRKTASAVSANTVEAKTPSTNAAPSFAEQDDDVYTSYIDVARSVAENTAEGRPIGRRVSAVDPDDDILVYELLDTPDLEDDNGEARFTIDNLSGQIRVGKELGADAGEREDEDSTSLTGASSLPEDEDAGDSGNSEYVLRVKVGDPSTASATVNIIVRVADVNEAPAFYENAPTLLRVEENVDPPVISIGLGGPPIDAATYAVTDQDGIFTGPHPYDDTTYTYSVTGVDSGVLTFDSDGVLNSRTGHAIDYEEKSSYAITIVARSGDGPRKLSTALDVTIEVVDGKDVGYVVLSKREPQVGRVVHARVRDPEGGVNINRWVWVRAVSDGLVPSARCGDLGVDGGWVLIGEPSSSVYVPKPVDVGRCLRATTVYTDYLDDSELNATGVLEVPVRGRRPPPDSDPEPELGFVNAAPEFPDQDLVTPGRQNDRTSREVAENTRAGRSIGNPDSAHDDDGNLLIHTLSGEDAASFDIERNTVQLTTRAALNYEFKSIYTVVVTATDPVSAAASILGCQSESPTRTTLQ